MYFLLLDKYKCVQEPVVLPALAITSNMTRS